MRVGGEEGTYFAVWAPNADRVVRDRQLQSMEQRKSSACAPEGTPASGKALFPAWNAALCTSISFIRDSWVTARKKPIHFLFSTKFRPRKPRSFGISIIPGATANGWRARGAKYQGQQTDFDLRNAPGFMAPSAAEGNRSLSYRELAPLLADYRAPDGIYSRGVFAVDGSSVFRLLGLSDHRLFCAVGQLWHAAGSDVSDRHAASKRYRRDSRLGAVAFSLGRARACVF